MRGRSLACAAVAVIGLFDLALMRDALLADTFGVGERMKATFASAGAFSAYLVLGLPVLLCQLVPARSRRGRDIWLVAATVVFVCIVLTPNMFGSFSLFVACAVFLVFTSSRAIPMLVCLFLLPILVVERGAKAFHLRSYRAASGVVA